MTTAAQIIAQGEAEIGKPYVYGDEGPNTFDCSGLMQFVFGKFGIKLPRTADEQYKWAKAIASPAAGDLVFFVDGSGTAQHVALYIGNGKMLSAPHAGAVVHISGVSNESGRVIHYGRVPGINGALAPVVAGATTVANVVSSTTSGLLGGAEQIVLEAIVGGLGLALIGFGIYKLSTGKQEQL